MPSSQTMSYKYNSDGIRTQKTFTDNAVKYYYKHDYILDGANIVAETITYFTYFGTNTTETLYYYYDEAGAPTGIKYNGNVYYFQKNLQGDIIRILNSSGSIVATYTYDAWGNIISSTDTSGVSIGTKNPFRYRGYYYDTETGLYYLNSRYYDPQVGRFINPDGISYLGANGGINSYNLYAYCSNNPIMYFDPSGHFVITLSLLLKAAVIIVAVAATANDIYQITRDDVYKDENENEVKKGVDVIVTSSNEGFDIKVHNSSKIVTPWVQYGYSLYLNHFNPDTKDIIDGTTIGLTYEWFLHNVAYVGCSVLGFDEYIESARSVNVGKTLFSDSHKGFIEHSMKISYLLLFPVVALTDLIINGGY